MGDHMFGAAIEVLLYKQVSLAAQSQSYCRKHISIDIAIRQQVREKTVQ